MDDYNPTKTKMNLALMNGKKTKQRATLYWIVNVNTGKRKFLTRREYLDICRKQMKGMTKLLTVSYENGVPIICLPDGEQAKCWQTVVQACNMLVQIEADRADNRSRAVELCRKVVKEKNWQKRVKKMKNVPKYLKDEVLNEV